MYVQFIRVVYSLVVFCFSCRHHVRHEAGCLQHMPACLHSGNFSALQHLCSTCLSTCNELQHCLLDNASGAAPQEVAQT
jgi:hypothetical protein